MKEQFFNKWLHSKEIDDFGSFKELILVEEFKGCVNRVETSFIRIKNG